MKVYSCILLWLLAGLANAQDVLHVQGEMFIGSNASVAVLGGVHSSGNAQIENNGQLTLFHSTTPGGEDWTNNASSNVLTGTGTVTFASNEDQTITGGYATTFHHLEANNTANGITLNNINAYVEGNLYLYDGIIHTSSDTLHVHNNDPLSIQGYVQGTTTPSYINGNLKRDVASNTALYAFPVGNATTYYLAELENNNLTGIDHINGRFEPLTNHIDNDMVVIEDGNAYQSVCTEGVWQLTPNLPPTAGFYNLHTYIGNFTGCNLQDNQFAILKRPDNSTTAADWDCENCGIGNGLNPNGGLGRLASDDYALRLGLTNFSEFGIGIINCQEIQLPNDTMICGGTLLTIAVDSGFTTYNWSNSNDNVPVTEVYGDPNQDQTITIEVSDNWGCVSSDDMVVSTYPSPIAEDDAASTQENNSVSIDVLNNDNTSGAVNIIIITPPANGSVVLDNNGNIIYTPNAQFFGQDEFTYLICDDAFCAEECDSAVVRIEIIDDGTIVIPGGISPNGDGMNDVFEIIGLESFPNNELQIFNRWGNLVYQAQPYQNDWNGQANTGKMTLYGDALPNGTYFYVLQLDINNADIPANTGYVVLKK